MTGTKRVRSIGDRLLTKRLKQTEPKDPTDPTALNGQDPKKPMDSEKTISCTICMDDSVLESESVTHSVCQHSVCKDCLTREVSSRLDQYQLEISCLHASKGKRCTQKFGSEFLLELLSSRKQWSSLSKKYSTQLLRRTLCADPNWIPCPDSTCIIGGDFSCNTDSEGFLSCQSCTVGFCPKCSKPKDGHPKDALRDPKDTLRDPKVSCVSEGSRDTEIEVTLETVKKCPSCQTRIEKSIGCDHMVCRSCQWEFCWLCSEPYYDGHIPEKHGPELTRQAILRDLSENPNLFNTRTTQIFSINGNATGSIQRQERLQVQINNRLEGVNVETSEFQGQQGLTQVLETHRAISRIRVQRTDPRTGELVFVDALLLRKNVTA